MRSAARSSALQARPVGGVRPRHLREFDDGAVVVCLVGLAPEANAGWGRAPRHREQRGIDVGATGVSGPSQP